MACGDGGILGPVVGVMGVLQALEAIKLMVSEETEKSSDEGVSAEADGALVDGNSKWNENGPATATSSAPPHLLLFSAMSDTPFRSVRLRSRRAKCAACSSAATVSADLLTSGALDYVRFCGAVTPVDELRPEERITARDYAQTRARTKPVFGDAPVSMPAGRDSGRNPEESPTICDGEKPNDVKASDHVLVDVRESVHYDLASLTGSINIPFSKLSAYPVPPSSPIPDSTDPTTGQTPPTSPDPPWLQHLRGLPQERPIYVICQLGNDSQLAVRKMQRLGLGEGGRRWIGDVMGGLRAWRSETGDFPEI